MSSGLGIRTIWITLRAANYTQQAFSAIQHAIDLTMKKEKDMDKINQSVSRSTLAFFNAGLMTSTLGISLAGAIFSIASSSRMGAGDFARLNQQLFLTKQAFADAFYSALKASGVLNLINNVLKMLQKNTWLQGLVVVIVALGAGLAIFAGAALLAKASILAVGGASALTTGLMNILNTATEVGTVAWGRMALAISAAVGIFIAFYSISKSLSPWASGAVAAVMAVATAVWFLYAGISAATMGVGLILGAGAAGAALATAQNLQPNSSFPIGTRSVTRDMNARLHKGEVVYNPNTNLPTSIGNELKGGSQPSVTHNYISMPIENMNTKADFDDVENTLSRVWRKNMRNVR